VVHVVLEAAVLTSAFGKLEIRKAKSKVKKRDFLLPRLLFCFVLFLNYSGLQLME
jgi:hypothetical protein